MAEEQAGAATTDAESEENRALRAPFEAWLGKRWPDVEALSVADFESPKSGFSAKTLFAPVRYRSEGAWREERLVLRVENPEPAIYPTQVPGLECEVEIQYRALEGLHAAGRVPLAPLVGFEPDPGVLGQPFYVMGYVGGEVATENPPYTQTGFFVDATPARRREILENGLRVMADLHRVDVLGAGFGWLIPGGVRAGLSHQLEVWDTYGRRELDGREHPVYEAGVRWVRDRLSDAPLNVVCWGDARLGNIIYDGTRVAAITDFENVCIAPREMDLGWWLMFDRTQHEVVSAPRLPGDLTREEQRDFYYSCIGEDLGDTHLHEVFAAVRYTAIVVRVMNRLVERGMLPADNSIWLQNPASQCLVDLLGMERPW